MTINGTYILEKNENLEGFLKGLGLQDDKVTMMCGAKPTITLNMAANKLEITSKVGDKTTQNILTMGTPSTYTLTSGFELEVNFTISGNCGKGTLKRGDRTGEFTIDFADSTVTEVFTVGGKSCKRIYKRM